MANEARTVAGIEADAGAQETHGVGGFDRNFLHASGVGIEPTGNIEGEKR